MYVFLVVGIEIVIKAIQNAAVSRMFILQQVIKAQRGSTGIALLFL
jgi:hypothetical protein